MLRVERLFFLLVLKEHIEIVKLLLNENRVDVNKANEDGYTPFHIACEYGHIEILKLLLNDKRIDINKARNDGETPLFFACLSGNIKIVELLLACGRDISLEDESGEEVIYLVEKAVIVDLLDSFERNPHETRSKLRIQLGLAGKSFLCNINNYYFLFVLNSILF